MKPLSPLIDLGYDDLTAHVRRIAAAGLRAHLHTTVAGCAITLSPRRAIVLESTDESVAYAFVADTPIEERAKPLAVVLHGAETVPGDDDVLEPPCEAVARMAERMRQGKGHFHILNPDCLVNPHRGRWTIVFEDVEMGVLESVSDDRPLADIRLVERLIYEK